MFISKVTLKDFRNYKSQEIEICEGINVISGDNAQGKTNFAEAVYIAACGKSHRFANDKSLIRTGCGHADIQVEYFRDNRLQINSVKIYENGKKNISVNKVPIKKLSEFVGRLNVVMFSPQDLCLVKEGPLNRRRFLDMIIGVLRPKYLNSLIKYNTALMQKSKLLKTAANTKTISEMLDVWNTELALYGSFIMKLRSEYIKRLSKAALEIQDEISGGKEQLQIIYCPSCKTKIEDNMNAMRNNYFERLSEIKNEEISSGICLLGVQRDDIQININGFPARVYGSQGQQRTIVLALTIAKLLLFYEDSGEDCVLILDDIASELDISRREYFFSKIKNRQVILTCTDADIVNMDIGSFLSVKGGEINVFSSGR